MTKRPRSSTGIDGVDSQAWLEGLNRAILDSALDCIITMDASGQIVEFNPAAERVLGYTRGEAVGKELAGIRAFSDGPGQGARFVLELAAPDRA